MLSITSAIRDAADVNAYGRPIQLGMAVSGLFHLFVLAALLAAISTQPASPAHPRAPLRQPAATSHLVFLATPGSIGGGGGGGGNRQSGPIRRAEAPGRDQITLRVARPIITTDRPSDADTPLPALALDAKPLASGVVEQVGLPIGGVSYGSSTGPGSGGGVGDGEGTGIGPGRGPGLGAGSGGSSGGGPYRPGGAVTPPELTSQVRPNYTADALDRRIQGSVELELVVTAEGAPSEIRVVRSLDPRGLDDEAIKAVRQWTFRPGRFAGAPVKVVVRVVLNFAIR